MRKEADCGEEVCVGERTSIIIKKNKILGGKCWIRSVGLYLPVIDNLAVASPDGVVCQHRHSSQREFLAFHLLHLDVENVRCVFLPRGVEPPNADTLLSVRPPAGKAGLFKKLFLFTT